MSTQAIQKHPIKVNEQNARVYFEGFKAIWRTRTNLQIVIIEHNKYECLEVISYDGENQMEAPKIFCDLKVLHSKLNTEEVDTKLKETKETFLRQRKDFDNNTLINEVKQGLISQFIIGRINITELNDEVMIVGLNPRSTDVVNEDGILDVIIECPEDLKRTELTLQKKATASDIKKALGALMNETHALSMANNRACKLAGLAELAVGGFKTMMEKRKKLQEGFSPARLRWVATIRRVIILNYIEAVKLRLERSPLFQTKDDIDEKLDIAAEEILSSRTSDASSAASVAAAKGAISRASSDKLPKMEKIPSGKSSSGKHAPASPVKSPTKITSGGSSPGVNGVPQSRRSLDSMASKAVGSTSKAMQLPPLSSASEDPNADGGAGIKIPGSSSGKKTVTKRAQSFAAPSGTSLFQSSSSSKHGSGTSIECIKESVEKGFEEQKAITGLKLVKTAVKADSGAAVALVDGLDLVAISSSRRVNRTGNNKNSTDEKKLVAIKGATGSSETTPTRKMVASASTGAVSARRASTMH